MVHTHGPAHPVLGMGGLMLLRVAAAAFPTPGVIALTILPGVRATLTREEARRIREALRGCTRLGGGPPAPDEPRSGPACRWPLDVAPGLQLGPRSGARVGDVSAIEVPSAIRVDPRRRGSCIEAHDLVRAKLAAGRVRNWQFVETAIARVSLPDRARERAALMSGTPRHVAKDPEGLARRARRA